MNCFPWIIFGRLITSFKSIIKAIMIMIHTNNSNINICVLVNLNKISCSKLCIVFYFWRVKFWYYEKIREATASSSLSFSSCVLWKVTYSWCSLHRAIKLLPLGLCFLCHLYGQWIWWISTAILPHHGYSQKKVSYSSFLRLFRKSRLYCWL